MGIMVKNLVLEDVANFKGSRAEAWLMMYCKQTQPSYNKLSEEEKHWLMRIAQKSKLAKVMFSREGRGGNRYSLITAHVDLEKLQ